MKIKKITKESYEGKVYNLELNSKNQQDDLYWIEGTTGIVTHNCFPKDIAALKFIANNLGVDTTVLDAAIEKNTQVRTDLDWTKQIGRAVSDD
jgi:hypothetical protein